MSNGLDPDQAQHCVGPDLGPNCLQKLSADDTRRQQVNTLMVFLTFFFFWKKLISNKDPQKTKKMLKISQHAKGLVKYRLLLLACDPKEGEKA